MTSTSIASVLIVDDSAVQRAHAAGLCRELGIRTLHEATSGREALAMLPALIPAPELMLLDLEMPTMDGAEVLDKLRPLGTQIPVVLVSSRERALLDSMATMGRAMGLQILAVLSKPLRIESLRRALQYGVNVTVAASAGPDARSLDAASLRAGLERGEIIPHYQPIVDMRSGAVTGVEVLARWEHPRLGLLLPEQFIELSERSGLIQPLTLQIMAQAMFDAAMWGLHGLDLGVAINLSSRLLAEPRLVEQLADIQLSHGMRSERISFELMETSMLADVESSMSVLSRLRLHGFGLALDDYGTGYCSMQQLSALPLTTLKIDRSFVHGTHERESLRLDLRSALELARQLGLATVAEGVETLQDWEQLQQFGCDFAQGWFIARPMPVEELMRWLEAGTLRLQRLRCQA